MVTDTDMDAPIEIETSALPTACVIWLHGLGADGHDFEGLIPQLHLPPSLALRFVFPHAPFRPVTINGGAVMRAWYDIVMNDGGLDQNMGHVQESTASLSGLIQQQLQRGMASERILLGGFSQGGAIAMQTGLTYPQRLAGILSLSAPLPDARRLMDSINEKNIDLPIFVAHGTDDPLIPFSSAQAIHDLLKNHDMNVEWHSYPMGHAVIPEEIVDVARWLTQVLR